MRLPVRRVRVRADLAGDQPPGHSDLPLCVALTHTIAVGLPGGDEAEIDADPVDVCLTEGEGEGDSPEAVVEAAARDQLADLAAALASSVAVDPRELAGCPVAVELSPPLREALLGRRCAPSDGVSRIRRSER